jgi:putative endonuclease
MAGMAADQDPRHELGRKGEKLAEKYLKQRGLKTVARHYSTPVGELDLVMRDGQTLVFAEVKTRRDRKYADPQDAVRYEKQRCLTRAAQWFIRRRGWEDRPCRFDLIAVILPPGGEPEIEYFPDAFPPVGP